MFVSCRALTFIPNFNTLGLLFQRYFHCINGESIYNSSISILSLLGQRTEDEPVFTHGQLYITASQCEQGQRAVTACYTSASDVFKDLCSRPRPRTWDQGQGQEILKANTKDIQKPLRQRHTTMKNIQCSTRD